MSNAKKFTTFFATQIDPSHEQQVRRYESRVVRAYENMEKAAKKASVGPGSNSGFIRGQRQLDQLAESRLRATDRQVAANTRLAQSETRLQRGLQATATALNVVQGPLGPLAGRVSAVSRAISELTGVTLGFAAVGATIFTAARLANEYAAIEGRLKALYPEQEKVNKSLKDVGDIARASRQDLSAIADLYVRIASVGPDVGIDPDKIKRITELASKAAALSGGSRQTQEAGLTQFAQGLGSNQLGGDELKSIKENTFALAQAIAKGLGVPIGALKDLGAEGKLTAKVVSDALLKSADDIDARFSRLTPTLGQSFSALSNSLLQFTGRLNESTGLTTTLGSAIMFLADNLSGLATILVGVGSAFAAAKFGKFLNDITVGQKGFITVGNQVGERARAILAAAQNFQAAASIEVVATRNTVAALKEKLVATQADAKAARQAVVAGKARVAILREEAVIANGLGGTTRALRDAEIEVTNAQHRLAVAGQIATATQEELAIATNTLTTAETRQTIASNRLEKAKLALAGRMTFAGRAAGALGGALGALLSPLNLLTIGIGILVPLVISWATAQDAAADAADHLAERQSNLAKFVSITTGKIIEQNQALLAQERIKAANASKAALDSYNTSRGKVTGRAANFTEGLLGGARLPADANKAIADYQARRINASQLGAKLEASLQKNPQAAAFLKPRINAVATTVATARDYASSAAYERLLAGKARPGDIELAQGNFGAVDPTGKDIAAGKVSGGGGKPSKGGGSKSGGAAEMSAAEKAQERLTRAAEKYGEKRRDILQSYSEEATAVAKANDKIDDLYRLADKNVLVDGVAFIGKTREEIEKIKKTNPLGRGIYTQEMAQNDAKAIEEGVKRPLRDVYDQMEMTNDLQGLRLQGYDMEATALEKVLDVYRQIGEVPDGLLQDLVDQQEKEEQINDALRSRQKLLDQYLGTADTFRDTLTDLIVDFPKEGFKSVGKAVNTLFASFQRQIATRISEKLFSGLDTKLRKNTRPLDGVQAASDVLEKVIKRDTERRIAQSKLIGDVSKSFAEDLDQGSEALDKFTTAVNNAANGLNGTAGGTAGGVTGATTTLSKAATSLGNAISRAGRRQGSAAWQDGEIVVTANRKGSAGTPQGADAPSITSAFKSSFEELGAGLDKIFGSKFFKGIGGAFGDAFSGAGTGVIASGFAQALGIKQSKTGAAIGGAIGKFLPIPGGDIIGGLIGGTIGGLFKKAKTGTANIQLGQFGELQIGSVGGNNSKAKVGATEAATTVIGRISSIAQALGGSIVKSPTISIGSRDGSFRVDPTGKGQTKTKKGAIDFGDDLESAIAYSVKLAIQQGVVGGISAASQRILQSGQDLQAAIEKAAIIESIPKRLMARTDPVRYAVEELNREFTNMINILKEAGATDQQFSDAAKLYALERADAIEQATKQAGSAIQDFIDNLTAGSDSPFSKRTTFENAQKNLLAFQSDVNSGKAVDNEKLLAAAQNYEQALSALEGRGIQYFDGLSFLMDLLNKAKANSGLTGTNGANLPASPFEGDPTVQAAIARANGTQVDAINTQTNVLSGGLGSIGDILTNIENILGNGIYAVPLIDRLKTTQDSYI